MSAGNQQRRRRRRVSRRRMVQVGAKLAYVTPAIVAVVSAARAGAAFAVSSPTPTTEGKRAKPLPTQSALPGASPQPAKLPPTSTEAPAQPAPLAIVKPAAPPPPAAGASAAPTPLPTLPKAGTGGRAHLMPDGSE